MVALNKQFGILHRGDCILSYHPNLGFLLSLLVLHLVTFIMFFNYVYVHNDYGGSEL